MKQLGMNELRRMYLDFFGKEKNHTVLKSFPLTPIDDDTLLLINAGMAPLKKYFTGELKMKNNRATSSQRCVRTGDIERVGKTERHGTFFEMLGNFSFGDYFKREAINWAFEFLTQKLDIDKNDLWVTVYHDDDEAFNIWNKEVGIAEERILKQGKEDNFWELEVGPCGPCSEIFVDRGVEKAVDENDNQPGNDDSDRFMEVWNLVFTQFNKDNKGEYTALAHPNIDTGMGLERIAMVLQGKDNIFEIDVMQEIISEIEKLANKKYKTDKKDDVSIRVIADHAKAMTFLVSDGVIPSNEKRGYVLRRLIRRAARHGKLLGIEGSFLNDVVDKVVDTYKVEYSELVDNIDRIHEVIKDEEKRFQKTINQGLEKLDELIKQMEIENKKVLDGSEAFKLYDTYGFPLDLTKEILEEKNYEVDENKFEEEMENQRNLARSARKSENKSNHDNLYTDDLEKTEFLGYDSFDVKAKVLAIFKHNKKSTSISASEDGIIVSNKTSFYPEGGGQVADTGYIKTSNALIKVVDVQKKNDIIFHYVEVIEGQLNVDEEASFIIDLERRYDIQRNHSATHLLDQALIDILGTNIKQAGSLVDENRLRFDFSHNKALTKDELKEIENIVNKKIREQLPVKKEIMNYKKSEEIGAIGLFEDKYKDEVRVVSMGDYSKELCGGCHVNNTSEVLMFKIESESSAAAGVRRIEAITGRKVYDYIIKLEGEISSIADELSTNANTIHSKIRSIISDIENKEKEIKRLKTMGNKDLYQDLKNSVKKVNDANLLVYKFENASMDELRDYENRIKNDFDNLLIVFASVSDKIIFTVSVDEKLTNKYDAGKIVREVAKITGGNGGGRKNFAQAGGSDISKVDKALEKAYEIIKE